MNPQVSISRAVLDEVVAHARDALPAECCGVLLGGVGAITEAARAANLSADPNRYLIDPKTHIDVRRDARVRGLAVVGFYHSHPHSPAEPSESDLREASYPDHLYLIVSLVAARPEVRLFRLDGQRFVSVEFDRALE